MKANCLDVARDLALEAGALLKKSYGGQVRIDYKGEIDLVTESDRRSEALILQRLQAEFPDHHIITEEEAAIHGTSEYWWYVDPLDGTTNYAHGFPMFCVSIALWEKDVPLLGVVFDPMHDELFEARRGEGAFHNHQRIHVSPTAELGKSLLATGFPYDIRESADNNLDHFSNLVKRCQGVRRLGAAALDLCYVAAGRLDGFWELKLQPWDTAAGTIIVSEAGGHVSDFRGQPFYPRLRHVAATNGFIHRQLIEVLATGHSMMAK